MLTLLSAFRWVSCPCCVGGHMWLTAICLHHRVPVSHVPPHFLLVFPPCTIPPIPLFCFIRVPSALVAFCGSVSCSGPFIAAVTLLVPFEDISLPQPTGLQRSSLPELMARGAALTAAPRLRPPSAIHTILHTSGTTGAPKGVIYSDRLWLANMVTYDNAFPQVGFSYMPLAFITDRHTVYTTLWNGGRVGLLTPAAAGADFDRGFFDDLLEVKPTVLKGVPKLWEQVLNGGRLSGPSRPFVRSPPPLKRMISSAGGSPAQG